MNQTIVKKFHHLLEKDKQENLEKRWNFFMSEEPEWTQRKLGFTPMVIEHKWAVIFIPAEGKDPEFAFTIGLYYNFKSPEILIIGAGLDQDQYKRFLNSLGHLVKSGKKLQAGVDYGPDIELSVSLIFEKANDKILKKFPYGYGGVFYTNFADTGKTPPILYKDLRNI